MKQLTPTRVALSRAWMLAVLGAATAACAAEPRPAAEGPVVRTDNGVVIVENPGVHLADTVSWFIDDSATVRIGGSIGRSIGHDELLIGRLAGFLLRPDGTILFGDATTHELYLFDTSGAFIMKVGRRGEGPNEFARLSRITSFRGDSVLVFDNEDGRAHVLDERLEFVRRFRPTLRDTLATTGMTSHRLVGFFTDGRLLMSDYLNACGRPREGFCEDSVAFYRTDDGGATTARFGNFVYSRSESHLVGDSFGTGWGEPHPQAFWAVRGHRFYYGDAKRFEVRIYRDDGMLERVIRLATPERRYTREEFFPSLQDAPSSSDPRIIETMRVLADAQRRTALPDPPPAFSDLLVDAEGNIWVREYTPPGMRDAPRPRWLIFDPDGHLRWAVRTHRLFRFFRPNAVDGPQIGSTLVLNSERDRDGVENVVLFRLRKDGSN